MNRRPQPSSCFRLFPPSSHASSFADSARKILGDVNPDSEVIAGGDVLVWGSLRGDVTAGADGDVKAQVFSVDMRPSSVTIAGVAALSADPTGGGPDGQGAATGVPEFACVEENEIVVTPATGAGHCPAVCPCCCERFLGSVQPLPRLDLTEHVVFERAGIPIARRRGHARSRARGERGATGERSDGA